LLVDTHCHLNFERFAADRSQVIERALQSGVERMLNPGVDLVSSREALDLAERYAVVYAAVGVHPNDSNSWSAGSLAELRALAAHPKVVAIGEIGLDYYRERAVQSLQARVFREQLELAAELGLPVVIHTRDASEGERRASQDVLAILAEWVAALRAGGNELAERPGVLHSYSSGPAYVEQALALGLCLGISGPVTFSKAGELRQAVAGTPPERLLIETDAPFLTPQPYRGKRNEPAYVRYVAEKIAEIHDLPFDSLAQTTTAGAERLFRWQVLHHKAPSIFGSQ
jgi:TatD DNase family protein